jgi:hypothetical protein
MLAAASFNCHSGKAAVKRCSLMGLLLRCSSSLSSYLRELLLLLLLQPGLWMQLSSSWLHCWQDMLAASQGWLMLAVLLLLLLLLAVMWMLALGLLPPCASRAALLCGAWGSSLRWADHI